MTHDHRLSNKGILAEAWIGAALLVLAGCATHLEFPPMGTPLPASAKLETSSALKDLTLHYTDTCGQLQEVPLGGRLQEALQAGLHRTFDRMVSEGAENADPPDHVVQVDLIDSSFDLNKEALYDRAPALIHLNAIARVYDRTILPEAAQPAIRGATTSTCSTGKIRSNTTPTLAVNAKKKT